MPVVTPGDGWGGDEVGVSGRPLSASGDAQVAAMRKQEPAKVPTKLILTVVEFNEFQVCQSSKNRDTGS